MKNNNIVLQVFNEKFKELSANSQWREIIQLGTIALEDASLTDAEKANIHARLASSFYYLGTDYTEAHKHAKQCYELAKKHTNPEFMVKGSYLLSATLRAQNHHAQAKEYAFEAKCIYDKYELNDLLLKGKIYFNLGAAEGNDPNGDLVLERSYYMHALLCYTEIKASDDIFRVVSRLIINAVRRGDLAFAEEIRKKNITEDMIDIQKRSTGQHYLALSQLYHLKQNNGLARFYAGEAVEIAKFLNAHADLEKAQAFLHSLELYDEKSWQDWRKALNNICRCKDLQWTRHLLTECRLHHPEEFKVASVGLLHFASKSLKYDYVKLLLKEFNIDCNDRCSLGETALHKVFYTKGPYAISIAHLLLDHGAKILPDQNGETPIDYFIKHEIWKTHTSAFTLEKRMMLRKAIQSSSFETLYSLLGTKEVKWHKSDFNLVEDFAKKNNREELLERLQFMRCLTPSYKYTKALVSASDVPADDDRCDSVVGKLRECRI